MLRECVPWMWPSGAFCAADGKHKAENLQVSNLNEWAKTKSNTRVQRVWTIMGIERVRHDIQ